MAGSDLRRLRRVRAVVFDCDSTLSALEGIDEIAREHHAEIGLLTAAAMRGEVPLEQVYGRRLELVRPSRQVISALGRKYVERMVPDADGVIRALRSESIEVRIMSGGLRQAVLALGQALGLPPEHVAAVDLRFTPEGEYDGFDTASPLARAGGKRELLALWRRELVGPVMMVGDGATDLEARSVADVFVAFAGVVAREPVVAAADVAVHSRSLAPILVLALAGEAPRDPTFQPLFRRGVELLEPEYHSCLPRLKV